MAERVAWILRRHGAYLISHTCHPGAELATPEELFDVASSLVKAKRVARWGAESLGATGPWKWEDDDIGLTLWGSYD